MAVNREDIFYFDAKTKIVDFLSTEFVDFPIKLQNRFLNFFPNMASYEEEGIKYKPSILFTNNIDAVMKVLPSGTKIELFTDENEHMFASRLKVLVPFCSLDWAIYINISAGEIKYGIFRNLNSIKEPSYEDLIFSNETLREKSDKLYAIYARPENSWTIKLKSIKGRTVNVNFALDIKTVNDWEEEIHDFVDASFSQLKTTSKKLAELKTLYRNVFKNVLRNINGTICVVVDKDYSRDEDDFLSDGIWLKEPISLSKLFIQTQNYNEQKLQAITNVFLAMMNFDGITVVDNTGAILAYNVFVEANLKTAGNIIGGARKRAAYTIINSRKKGIIGVYFQSHDGEMFYAPVKK